MNSINFNNQTISYTLVRKKVKNINMRINPNGEVSVSAPPYVSKEVIENFVRSNAQRIIDAKIRFASLREMSVKYKSGDILYILGKKYPLQIIHSDKNRYLINSDSVTFYLCHYSDINVRRALYDKLLLDVAKKVFPEIMVKCVPLFSGKIKSVPTLKIRKMSSQWGNCRSSKNVVTLNSRLAAYGEDVIKSVVCHEYCHFFHHNHSQAFYDCLASVMPDWKKYDNDLKNKLIYCYFIDNE